MPKPNGTLELDGLGTHWWVELLERHDFPADLASLVTETVKLFDDTYSRFKADSLIGQLNAHKQLDRPPKELLDMLAFAQKMHAATNGAFDISVGGVLQRLGYGDTKTATHTQPNFWSQVNYDRYKIVIPDENAIDLGGFGKGWLLDKLAVMLEQRGYQDFLINGGGDIVVHASKPVEFGLEHPCDPTKVIGTTKIRHGALAVSSTVKRRWVKNSTISHHIIDPATQQSSDNGVVSAYVKGATALIADTLATVLVLQPDLKTQLEKQFKIKTIIVTSAQIL